MKYKLINKQTNEEHVCSKVTIDGFDYYVSEEFIEEGDFAINLNTKHIKQYDGVKGMDSYWKKVIACNNSNIDISKVVDEVDQYTMAQEYAIKTKSPNKEAHRRGFVEGYNKSQETYPFSDENMIEFAISGNYKGFTKEYMKSIFQLWKEQKPKMLFYE